MNIDELQINVVTLLRKIRIDAGLHQKDLAILLNKPQSFVSKYESGARQLNILEIREICAQTGVSLLEFVKLLEESINNGATNEAK